MINSAKTFCDDIVSKVFAIRKVLMISPGVSLRGGAEVFSYELAKSIADNNIEVVVVTFSSSCNSKQSNFNKRLRTFPILRKGRIGLFINFFHIFRLLISEQFDVVHAHFVFPMAFWGSSLKYLEFH